MPPVSTAKVLVTFALETEAAAFRPAAKSLPEARILVTGVGPRNSRRALEAWLAQESPRRIVTCGFAGSLAPDLRLGQLVYEGEATAAEAARLAALEARPVKFHQADKILISAAEKRAAFLRHRAEAVEMESAVIRELGQARGLPVLTLRAISDLADEDLPLDFNALADTQQNPAPARVLLAALQRPGVFPKLWRLRQNCRRAAESLARGLVALLGG